jgi:hypothetical protein
MVCFLNSNEHQFDAREIRLLHDAHPGRFDGARLSKLDAEKRKAVVRTQTARLDLTSTLA